MAYHIHQLILNAVITPLLVFLQALCCGCTNNTNVGNDGVKNGELLRLLVGYAAHCLRLNTNNRMLLSGTAMAAELL